MINKLYSEYFGKELYEHDLDISNYFVLKMSLPATAYDFFMCYLIKNIENDIFPIKDFYVYAAVK